MNVDPWIQLRLLDLQAADTALAQLAHRRRTLPEIAQLAQQTATVQQVQHEVVDAQTDVDDIGREQARLEADVDTVRNRTVRDEARLQQGGLPSRELEQLQHEITSLARRQGTLEDDLLEVMERAEQAAERLDAATSRHAGAADRQHELTTARDAGFADVDALVAQRRPERDAVAATLPADLLALYDKNRAAGAHGAALLRQRRCEGCRIELSGSEVARVRAAAPDLVVRCDNCRAILVRTDESGL